VDAAHRVSRVLGFVLVESGLCRAKNTVNILAKNFRVFAVSSVAFLPGLFVGGGTAQLVPQLVVLALSESSGSAFPWPRERRSRRPLE
jgi:hypothetical protein